MASQLPPAPSAVTLSNITNNSMRTYFHGNGTGTAAFLRWELGYSTNIYPTTVKTSPGTLDVTGLTPATTYYFYARCINIAGPSPWSARSSAATLDVPAMPNPVDLTNATQTSVYAWFTRNGDGGSPVLEWQLGYGLDPVTPTQAFAGYYGTMTGMVPGETYYFWGRVRNTFGWSPYSGRTTVTLLAGAWVDVAGVKTRAVPYVRDAGVWKVAEGWVKIAGMWKPTD
jgi:hypothetical protein